MMYVLDTDLFTLSEISDSAEYFRLRARVAQLPREDEVTTTIITYEEQTRGWFAYAAKSRNMDHQVKAYAHMKRHLRAYLKIDVVDFETRAAQEFERLQTLKLHVGTLDLKIAAIVLVRNAVLLSRNLKDFKRIPGLRVEDWTRE